MDADNELDPFEVMKPYLLLPDSNSTGMFVN